MQFIKLSFLVLFFLFITNIDQTKTNVIIQNNSVIERKQAVVSIKCEAVLATYPQINTVDFIVINTITNPPPASQLEYQGQKSIQKLLMQFEIKLAKLFIQNNGLTT